MKAKKHKNPYYRKKKLVDKVLVNSMANDVTLSLSFCRTDININKHMSIVMMAVDKADGVKSF